MCEHGTGVTRLAAGALAADADVRASDYRNADLRNMTAPRLQATRIELDHAKLDAADLRDACFERADARRSSWKDADLRGACFHEAKLYQSDFSGADARGADFTDAYLDRVTWTRCRIDATTKFSRPMDFAALGFVIEGDAPKRVRQPMKTKLNPRGRRKAETGLVA